MLQRDKMETADSAFSGCMDFFLSKFARINVELSTFETFSLPVYISTVEREILILDFGTKMMSIFTSFHSLSGIRKIHRLPCLLTLRVPLCAVPRQINYEIPIDFPTQIAYFMKYSGWDSQRPF